MIKELIIPLGVLIALASMILPLPTEAVDFMLVGNLLLAFLLLVNAMYVTDPLKLSALPTMLLLATLFRLALNVTTTRLVLAHGDAGKAVEAFGSVVISGNVAVGVVVFLVITLIQFIVIAKGSERVAEVAARFTLDALPGKQMSIDADVRAGQIDFETARQRRQDLQTESRFYGALDGAMKFIKGDAIAGIVVVCINIIGGLAVGILMLGLDFGAAVNKYTVLTVGDGLLSQIPALLNSLAAGMVVTRVARGDGSSLAKELIGQIGQIRRVKVIVGVVSLLLAIVDGMPRLPLITLAAVLFVSAAMDKPEQPKSNESKELKFQPKVVPLLELEISATLGRTLITLTQFTARLEQVRQHVYDTIGLILKAPELSLLRQGESDWRLKLRGIVIAQGKASEKPEVELDRIATALQNLVQRHAVELVDDMMTRRLLDHFEGESSELVAAVVPNVLTLTQLTEVLKALLREGIPVRNFDIILQAVAEHGPKAGGERPLLEAVRVALSRVISGLYASAEGAIRAHTIESTVDIALARVEKDGAVLDPEVIQAIAAHLEQHWQPGEVLLVSRRARRLLRECLEIRDVRLPVIAHDEVVDGTPIHRVSHVELPSALIDGVIETQLAA